MMNKIIWSLLRRATQTPEELFKVIFGSFSNYGQIWPWHFSEKPTDIFTNILICSTFSQSVKTLTDSGWNDGGWWKWLIPCDRCCFSWKINLKKDISFKHILFFNKIRNFRATCWIKFNFSLLGDLESKTWPRDKGHFAKTLNIKLDFI